MKTTSIMTAALLIARGGDGAELATYIVEKGSR